VETIPGFKKTTAFSKTYSSTVSARLDSFLANTSSEEHRSDGIPNRSISSLDTYNGTDNTDCRKTQLAKQEAYLAYRER